MIPAITAQLESFNAKVQATIDHVASGVNNLNEDQQDQAVEMLHNLGEEFYGMKDRCLEALGVETLTERLAKAQANEASARTSTGSTVTIISTSVEPPAPAPEPPVDPPADPQSQAADPSAADLDQVAEEQKAADATAGVDWSGFSTSAATDLHKPAQ